MPYALAVGPAAGVVLAHGDCGQRNAGPCQHEEDGKESTADLLQFEEVQQHEGRDRQKSHGLQGIAQFRPHGPSGVEAVQAAPLEYQECQNNITSQGEPGICKELRPPSRGVGVETQHACRPECKNKDERVTGDHNSGEPDPHYSHAILLRIVDALSWELSDTMVCVSVCRKHSVRIAPGLL